MLPLLKPKELSGSALIRQFPKGTKNLQKTGEVPAGMKGNNMTATVNKTTAISQNENTTQAQEWTLIPTCETIEYGETCKTPTGHYVKVKTTHQPSSISLVIEVFNEYGHVTACTAFFGRH